MILDYSVVVTEAINNHSGHEQFRTLKFTHRLSAALQKVSVKAHSLVSQCPSTGRGLGFLS